MHRRPMTGFVLGGANLRSKRHFSRDAGRRVILESPTRASKTLDLMVVARNRDFDALLRINSEVQ